MKPVSVLAPTPPGQEPSMDIVISLTPPHGVFLVAYIPESEMDVARSFVKEVVFPTLYPHLKKICEDTEIILNVIQKEWEEEKEDTHGTK